MKSINIKDACCLFLIVACMVACRPPAATISTSSDSTRLKKDSTWVIEKTRIDTVRLPGDTVRFETLIECDKTTNKPKDVTAKVRGANSTMEIKLRSGLLSVMSQYDSVVRLVHSKDTQINHLQETLVQVNKQKQEVRIVKEYKTHWYDYVCRVLAAMYVAVIVLRHFKLI